MRTERERSRCFARNGSLCLLLNVYALWMIAIGNPWASVPGFLIGELAGFRAGYVLMKIMQTADRGSRWFRIARLLVNIDDRPPLSEP